MIFVIGKHGQGWSRLLYYMARRNAEGVHSSFSQRAFLLARSRYSGKNNKRPKWYRLHRASIQLVYRPLNDAGLSAIGYPSRNFWLSSGKVNAENHRTSAGVISGGSAKSFHSSGLAIWASTNSTRCWEPTTSRADRAKRKMPSTFLTPTWARVKMKSKTKRAKRLFASSRGMKEQYIQISTRSPQSHRFCTVGFFQYFDEVFFCRLAITEVPGIALPALLGIGIMLAEGWLLNDPHQVTSANRASGQMSKVPHLWQPCDRPPMHVSSFEPLMDPC